MNRLGIATLQDILFHLPLRYEDRTRVTPILAIGIGETVVIEGEIVSCEIAYGRRRSLLAYLQDSTGRIALRFFHFSKAQQRNLSNAGTIRCFGEARRGAAGLEIYHPEYENLSKSSQLSKNLTPVYPMTEGISQARFRALVEQVMSRLEREPLAELLNGNRLDLTDAIRLLHRPPASADIQARIDEAQRRLAFEELLAHHSSLRYIKEQISTRNAPRFSPPGEICRRLEANLGFILTGAQQRVLKEIGTDLTSSVPMLRLLQGDVGSGKTVIAALSAVHAFESNLQTAIMAPTEVLAEQHYVNFNLWLAPLGIQTSLLTGKIKGKKRLSALESIDSGNTHVIIGTHALFQKEVSFHSPGLIIIDEQHRFGVQQRLALREKGHQGEQIPHQLVMTATPIPRTLTMSMYADMDSSIIDELPPGRTPVITSVLPDNRRPEIISRIRSMCNGGSQAYWVCTLIEESELLESQAAEVTVTELTEALPELRISLIHGRMNYQEKSSVMEQFKKGEIDLLVATTVIEVGVDIPNATLMVIENSERLGLSQLHQLRGRVGRGTETSYCLLLYHPPLGELSKQRLAVVRASNDGFLIAEEDLKIRGPGELLGSRQSGSLDFRVADLLRDSDMLLEVRTVAEQMFRSDRQAVDAIIQRWMRFPDQLSQV